DRRVAIPAIDAVVARVVLMAERDRLLDRRVCRRVLARADAIRGNQSGQRADHAEECNAKKQREPPRKNLRHETAVELSPSGLQFLRLPARSLYAALATAGHGIFCRFAAEQPRQQ